MTSAMFAAELLRAAWSRSGSSRNTGSACFIDSSVSSASDSIPASRPAS